MDGVFEPDVAASFSPQSIREAIIDLQKRLLKSISSGHYPTVARVAGALNIWKVTSMDDRKSLLHAGSRKGQVAIDLGCFLPLAIDSYMSLSLLDEVFRPSRSSRRSTILVFVAKEPSGTLRVSSPLAE
jgi:hypothetical protein